MSSSNRVLKLFPLAALALTLACSQLQSQRTSTPAPPGPVQAQTTEPNVIPAGTTFAVRTNQTIESDQAGQSFSAEVVQDIQDQSGKVLVPKGSTADLVIVETSSGGAVGTRTVELAVKSVTANGKKYAITTAGTEQRGTEGLGRNRRTAEMVGGGALLGTLIGAVAGGGKGAAVGAAVGAAGGAAAQVLTRGDEVRVPAETILSFRLDEPWRLAA